MKNIKRLVLLVLMAMMLVMTTGCRRAFMEPKFAVAKPDETMIIIPQQGNSKDNQVKIDSVKYLEDHKAVSKRVPLNQGFIPTGRQTIFRKPGYWQVTDFVLIVSRAPVVKDWTKDAGTGTTSKNEAFEAQTKDEIGFWQGWAVTAYVPQEGTYKYAFKYQGKGLNRTLNDEVKVLAEGLYNMGTRKFTLAELTTIPKGETRTNEQILVDNIVKKVTKKFWEEGGIRITALSPKGQRMFINPAVQDSINNVYASARAKEAAANKREIAEKDAKTAREILKKDAAAQAEANKKVAASITPELIKLRDTEKWNGVRSQTVISGASGTGIIIPQN